MHIGGGKAGGKWGGKKRCLLENKTEITKQIAWLGRLEGNNYP